MRTDWGALRARAQIRPFSEWRVIRTKQWESASTSRLMLEAVGEGTKMAAHLSLTLRPAFPSSAIISERSSPSRVRFAAPNNGAPLTAPGPFRTTLLRRGKGSLRAARLAGDHSAATDRCIPFWLDQYSLSWRLCGHVGPWNSPLHRLQRRFTEHWKANQGLSHPKTR